MAASRSSSIRPLRPLDLLHATLAVGASVLAGLALRPVLPVASLALVFVCAVLLVATRSGKAVAVFSAVLASLAYNFFFTEPRYTLRIHSPAEIAAVLTFLLTALVVGHLGGRLRIQVSELAEARVESESEKLRSALLSSVSHDLRSPLSAVIGAATSLAAYGDRLSDADRRELLESIRSEGERLDRYIQNLLDMARLGTGPLRLHRDWCGLDEIVVAAVARLAHAHPATPVRTDLESGLPPLHVHAALLEQALFNLLENAAKFSPARSEVTLTARRDGDRLTIDVADRGPGIPPGERTKIFDLAYRVRRGDRDPHGSGLGLHIVRGMVGAHGGRVDALPGAGGVGTVLRISLPLADPPALPAEESA